MALSYGESGSFLYHYTRLVPVLEDIVPYQRLLLNPFSGMNDPREAREWSVSATGWGEGFGDRDFWDAVIATNRLKATCKLICFTEDATPPDLDDPEFARGYARPRMWAHYAENHRGVCLLFERDAVHERLVSELEGRGEFSFGPVRYANHGIPLGVLNLDMNAIKSRGLDAVLNDLVEAHSADLFFSKARDWETESEVRYLIRTEAEGVDYVSVQGTMRAVCMGHAVPDVYEPSLHALCDEHDLDLLKIIWENGRPLVVVRPPPDGSPRAEREPRR